MHIVANDSEFDIDANTTLLQALRQHGIAANFSCRNGNCGLCEAHLNAGRVWLDDRQQLIDAPTTLLLCRAFARCDLNLRIDITPRAVSRFCRVLRLEKKASGYDVELLLPAGRAATLLPGDCIGLEESRDARRIPLTVMESRRTLTLHLFDEDSEWLSAVRTGGVRIVLVATAAD